MTTPRIYYEALLDSLEKIVKLEKDDFKSLRNIQKELNKLVKKIKAYRIFELNFSDQFYEYLEADNLNDFTTVQCQLSEELYNALGEILYNINARHFKVDYQKILEVYRTELPYEIAKSWNNSSISNEELGLGQMFHNCNEHVWNDIKSKEQFEDYKKRILENISTYRYKEDPNEIPQKKFDKIESFFKKSYQFYNKYIHDNYPTICTEFLRFRCDIRVYIIDQAFGSGAYQKQIVAYESESASIKVDSVLHDFIPFHYNVEEINKDSISKSIGVFEIDNPKAYSFEFTVSSIHHELSQIFLRNANEKALKEFLIFLLRSERKSVSELTEIHNELELGKNDYAKLYLANVPNLKSLKKDLFESGVKSYSLVAFTTRPDDETTSFLKENEIEVIDINSLVSFHINNQNGNLIHWYIKSNLKDIQIDSLESSKNEAEELIEDLKQCPTGLKGWVEYEDICTKIFKLLFNNDFRNYTSKIQSYTHDNIFRRDLVVNNNFKDHTSFWAQINRDFNCNMIVIDFKNYTDPLEQNEFYLPSKYLNLGTGGFGLIISRKGLGNSARILQRRMLSQQNQLLISLTDDDLIGMLNDRLLNIDPSYRLENLKFALYQDV